MTDLEQQLARLEASVVQLEGAIDGMVSRNQAALAAVATKAAQDQRQQILTDAQTVMREVDSTIDQLELVLQRDDQAKAALSTGD